MIIRLDCRSLNELLYFKYLTIKKFKATLKPRETCSANCHFRIILVHFPTLPNPLSRSFRTIGARNNFPANHQQFTVLHLYLHTLYSKHKSEVSSLRYFDYSSRKTGRQSLPTFSTVLAENFHVKAISITSPSVHNLYHPEHTISSFFFVLIRRWSKQPLAPTPATHSE